MRVPAVKVPIAFLVNGRVIEETGKPIRIATPAGILLRARIMGRVVSKYMNEDETYGAMRIDDETETIVVKVFRDLLKKFKTVQPGDLVDVIGRVGYFQEEVYLIAEAFVVLKDVNWEFLRKLELATQKTSLREALINYLKEKGEEDAEKLRQMFGGIVDELYEEGVLYEPRKGVFALA